NQRLHQFAGGAKGGRAFRGVQHAKPSARSRANIEKTSPISESAYNRLRRASNCRNFLSHRRRYFAVFFIHQANNSFNRESIEIYRIGITHFGEAFFGGNVCFSARTHYCIIYGRRKSPTLRSAE